MYIYTCISSWCSLFCGLFLNSVSLWIHWHHGRSHVVSRESHTENPRFHVLFQRCCFYSLHLIRFPPDLSTIHAWKRNTLHWPSRPVASVPHWNQWLGGGGGIKHEKMPTLVKGLVLFTRITRAVCLRPGLASLCLSEKSEMGFVSEGFRRTNKTFCFSVHECFFSPLLSTVYRHRCCKKATPHLSWHRSHVLQSERGHHWAHATSVSNDDNNTTQHSGL